MDGRKTSEVFGVSNEVLPDSYVDRGALDSQLKTLLERRTHVALRGESKCGKSWLRQRNIPDPLVVQCRLGKTVTDIYVDALSQLGIALELQRTESGSIRGQLSARVEGGVRLLAKLGLTSTISGQRDAEKTHKVVGHDVSDLRFVADLIRESNRRLVVEDFHYMSVDERRHFAFDLKALWDYGLFVVIVGVWNQSNMLLYLNSDLSGRVRELSIYWSSDDLTRVLEKGAEALNLIFNQDFKKQVVKECFNNVGILQTLALESLDELGILQAPAELTVISNADIIESAAMNYAEQLNSLYQKFAERVSGGIRTRRDATGIYAHAMAAILEASDDELLDGLKLDRIYEVAHAREPRIQKGNLRIALERWFEKLQVDDQGRGLVLAYNEATCDISTVDRQLLLYRKYLTVKWPWEDLIREAQASER